MTKNETSKSIHVIRKVYSYKTLMRKLYLILWIMVYVNEYRLMRKVNHRNINQKNNMIWKKMRDTEETD